MCLTNQIKHADKPRIVSFVLGPFTKLWGRRGLKRTESAQILQ